MSIREEATMKKAVIQYDSRGESGNIYWLLGALQQVMRKQRRITAFNDLRDRVFKAQSYTEALAIIGEEVELIDISV